MLFKVVYQNKDDLAFERIINNPKRAIGESTMKQIHEYSKKNSLSLVNSSKRLLEEKPIKPKAKIGLNFSKFFAKMGEDLFEKNWSCRLYK